MNILVCIPCLMTGGTEIQTLNLVRALVEAGHRVTTLCYFEFSDLMVQNYRKAGSEVVLLSPSGQRSVGVKNTVKTLYQGLKRAVKHCHPDVVHVQYMAPGAIPIVILRALGVKKIVATAHTAADIYPNLRLIHLLTRHFLTAFTCITERAERSFFGNSQLYTPQFEMKPSNNHFTIYNCLPQHIQVRTAPRVLGKEVVIGVVSRLERIKGMDLVVPAFAKIHAQYPHTHLLVVGDGSLRTLMEQQARELGLEEAVSFQGRQEQHQLQSYYDQIDILLMPSRSEGFGLTAIEGMARGCVVVAADTGGLPEVVKEGFTGFLHKTESVDDLALKVETLISNPALWSRCSAAALQEVLQFSYERFAQLFQSLYSQIAR